MTCENVNRRVAYQPCAKDHMYVKINWRVARPNGQFYERSDIQTFYADENNSAVLHNNGNEYLHYQDDWYIPGYKEARAVRLFHTTFT